MLPYPNGRGIRFKPGSVGVRISQGVRINIYALIAEWNRRQTKDLRHPKRDIPGSSPGGGIYGGVPQQEDGAVSNTAFCEFDPRLPHPNISFTVCERSIINDEEFFPIIGSCRPHEFNYKLL